MVDYFDASAALKLKPFKTSAAAIIRELSDRRILEEEFLPDPSGYLATRLHGAAAARIPRKRLNGANRFLFSIMSNDRFLGWLKEYQEDSLKGFEKDPLATIDKNKLRQDLARAMVEYGDAEIIGAALPGSLGAFDDPELVFDVIGNITGRPVTAVQNVTTDVHGVITGIDAGNYRMMDVAVEIETLIYAVAAVAVFAVAVAAVVVGAQARFADRAILRDAFIDTRDMGNIADALAQIGQELRRRRQL